MNMMTLVKYAKILVLTFAVGAAQAPFVVTNAYASDIRVTVNKIPITSLDLSHRVAFLKLQHKKGNLASQATDELIDETLKIAEMRRVGIRIPDADVDKAFANFASQNKLKPAQLEQVLNQSGVTPKHFKEYIRVQMGWGQTVGARFRATGPVSERDLVTKMMEKGGTKPSATEYMLQQVIFVVPAAKRGQIMGQRKKEAQAMRNRFNGCENTRQFATGLKDVTVKDFGRLLAPELPPEWADLIKKTQAGGATTIRETDKGVEFIGVCRAKEVSDDKAAAMVLQSGAASEQAGAELDAKYIKELRDHAEIVRR
jgi:peptidyl-prolyl cis-trans isomerase SurA